MREVAAATLLLSFWKEGERNNLTLSIAGMLLSKGMDILNVKHFIFSVAEVAGDREMYSRLSTIDSTAAKHKAGYPVAGYAKLCEITGKRVADKICALLGFDDKSAEITKKIQTTKEHIEKLNKKHAFLICGGRSVILKESEPDDSQYYEFIAPSAFRDRYGNFSVFYKGNDQPLGSVWMKHPDRRTYDGVVFDPSKTPAGYYNLYKGLAIEPEEGDCSLFLDHIKVNICSRNEELYQWFMCWFAMIVQKPTKKAGTAIVMRGRQGTGKSIAMDYLGSAIFGRHYFVAASPRYVTGNFNSFQADCLVLHGEEGFFAGDRTTVSILKHLITGDYNTIEYKGKDAIKLKNYVRLVITSNLDKVIQAGGEERRFAVFDMSEEHMQDRAYFGKLVHQMEKEGGAAALLHYLLNFDISKIDVGIVPKTKALLEQKIRGMSAFESCWFDLLNKGKLPAWGDDMQPWGICAKKHVQEYFIAEGVFEKWRTRRASDTLISNTLKKLVPHLDLKVQTSDKLPAYGFPPLGECRKYFEQRYGQAFEWEEPDTEGSL